MWTCVRKPQKKKWMGMKKPQKAVLFREVFKKACYPIIEV